MPPRPPAHGDEPGVADGITVDVHVRPGARRNGLDGVHDGVLAVRVSAPPADGQANTAVCALVATAFGVRPSAVTVRRGASSRRKQLHVRGDASALARRLAELRED